MAGTALKRRLMSSSQPLKINQDPNIQPPASSLLIGEFQYAPSALKTELSDLFEPPPNLAFAWIIQSLAGTRSLQLIKY
ncbi:hypothetical protein EG327_002426 [Venturia inaequalis]|uniref:Uncharacterized protein n=1 Tax=Venturia inaequalis TaxID=5025 RepID=A0A8H3ZAZ9_VENIN|nr:hypothetical protein EG327_002426 [Venturia inaequalis]